VKRVKEPVSVGIQVDRDKMEERNGKPTNVININQHNKLTEVHKLTWYAHIKREDSMHRVCLLHSLSHMWR